MRLYAFLLVAGAALCARAASIPVAETEKKLIDIVPDNLDKLPENTSSEQELIDQANTIKDVDNKLRTKPEDIPVEVVVESVQPALKADEQDEEINRPTPDLRNPGPPQRQEHETQNPEYYAAEQQTVLLFKQSIQDAQNTLNQGLQGITDGIQYIAANNEPIQSLQKNIQYLRDSFTAQMVKVNTTIQSFLNSESSSIDKPAAEQTKAGFHQFQQGLFKFRNDFNRKLSTLAEGVELVALLKADSEAQTESSGVSSTTVSTAATLSPVNPIMQIMQNVQTQMTNGWDNLVSGFNQMIGQGTSTTPAPGVPAGVQSDSQVTSAPPFATFFQNLFNLNQAQNQGQAQNPGQQGSFLQWPSPPAGQFGSGSGPISQLINWPSSLLSNLASGQAPQSTQPPPVQPPSKPEEASIKPETKPEPAKPAESTEQAPQAAAVTPAGPIRQILQNNPITQGIAGAVQRLQNVNNPEKPREDQRAEQIKKLDQDQADTEPKKGGGPNHGDNNDSSDSRIEQPEPVKEEIEKVPDVQKVPEVQKASEDEVKEHKAEEVVDKTE